MQFGSKVAAIIVIGLIVPIAADAKGFSIWAKIERVGQTALSFRVFDFFRWVEKDTKIPKARTTTTLMPTPTLIMYPTAYPILRPTQYPTQHRTQPQPQSQLRKTFIPRQEMPKMLPMARTTPSASPTRQPHVQSEDNDLANKFNSVEREVTILYGDKNIISHDHYKRLAGSLNELTVKNYRLSDIAKLKQMLVDLNPDEQANPQPVATVSLQPQQPKEICSDTRPTLVSDFTDFSKIQKITAPGTPVPPEDQDRYKGHSFIWTNYQRVPIYAPIDATLNSVNYGADNESSPAQYRLGFKVKENCNFSFRFDHVDEVVPAIKAVAPTTPSIGRANSVATPSPTPFDPSNTPKPIAVDFKAGDLVGYTTGTRQAGNWDFGLYDLSKEGPLGPLGAFGLGAYAVCWVDFFSPEKQAQYRNLLEGPRNVCAF